MNRKMLLGLAALVLISGCSKQDEATTTTETPQTASATGTALKVFGGRLNDPQDPLLTGFTAATGHPVELITDLQPPQIIAALKAGETPADVLMLVDSSTIQNFVDLGVLQPIESTFLEQKVPAYLRDLENGWVGYATRTRIIYTHPSVTDVPARFEDLADPRFKGQICMGSGRSAYSQSVVASILEHHDEAYAKQWAEGVVANLAKPAGGRDGELLAAVADGSECRITVANHYYYLRLQQSDNPEERAIPEGLKPVFPNQGTDDRGTYQNVMTFGLVQGTPNKAVAQQFLEYLLSEQTQQQVARGIFYPAIAEVQPVFAEEAFGKYKLDNTPFSNLGKQAATAAKILQEAGWQ